MYTMLNRVLSLMLLGLFLAGSVAVAQTPAGREQQAIRTMLQQRDAQIKSIVRGKPNLSDAERDRLRAVVNDVIDFEAMGRQALGAQWNDLTAAQRRDFVETFAGVVRAQSLADLDLYRADVRIGEITVQGQTATARTTASVQRQGKTVSAEVDYTLRKAGDRWLVTDFAIDEVSTAQGYQRSFQRILRQRGFDGLMTSLRNRLERG
jgi:phospholipid transport system substrate-binding protein